METEGVAADAQLRLLGHLDLGDQAASRRIPPGELDAGGFTDQTAASVAPDEILRPQALAIGQGDVHAAVVLVEAGHLDAVVDGDLQLADPAREDALDVLLPKPEPIRMSGGNVADVQADRGEPRDLCLLSLRQEPIDDPPLIEHLERACVQTARARTGKVLVGAPLDDGNIHTRECELARQHQPRGSGPGDHDRKLGHRNAPVLRCCSR